VPQSKKNYECCDIQVLGVEKQSENTVIYSIVLGESYRYVDGRQVGSESSSHIPIIYTVKESETGYELVDRWMPRDKEYDNANYFKYEDDKLTFIEEGSDNFHFVKLEGGAVFEYHEKTEDIVEDDIKT